MKKYIITIFFISFFYIFIYQVFFISNNTKLTCIYHMKYLSDNEIKKEFDFLWYNNLDIMPEEITQKWVIWIKYNITILNNSNKKISFFWIEQVLPANVVKETLYSSDKSFWFELNPWEKHSTLQYLFIHKTDWFSKPWMLDWVELLYSQQNWYNQERLYNICWRVKQ